VVGLGIAGLTYVALILQAVMGRGGGAGHEVVDGALSHVSQETVQSLGAPLPGVDPLSTMTQGQWFFAIVAMVCGLIALAKVWLPIVVDGLELTGKKINLPGWFDEEGVGSWMKCALTGAGVFGVVVGSAVAMGVLSSTPSHWLAPGAGKEFLTFFMIAVTIIVVAVPEGLAMSVTLSLAYSMRRMTASNNLVRRMHACETIGAATVICSDKTGTLTMNEMRVFHMEFPGFDNKADKADMSLPIVKLVCEAMSANSTANLASSADEAQKVMGNPTEGAMLLWMRDHGVDYLAERTKFKASRQWTFSTERKFMGTLGAPGSWASADHLVLHTKGAPEIILSRCTRVLTESGPVPIEGKREEVLKHLKEYQLRGMRTLGLAYHDAPTEEESLERLAVGMVWLGFVAIQDPVRPEVPLAIEACRKAGIAVKMVTGDNPDTAREVGRQIGLIDAKATNDGQLTGLEFGALDDERLLAKLPNMHVLSRARPMDKMRLVNLLQSQGHVVAVTGDGTNDAPALNHANVGLAMGKTGTAVAKEAADIILLDDSFQSIVNAVMWGRSLYLNIQRFVVFQLTINVAALGIAMLGPFIGVQLPLTVIQMLWINLIMDTFAALALATEPPSWNTMNNPPRKSTDFIVTGEMARSIFGTGLVFIVVLVGYLIYAQEGGVSDKELTLCFNTFVMLQFWNLFNARRLGSTASALTGMGENKSFLFIAAAILLGQVLIVQFGGAVFKTVPLSALEWGAIVGGTSVVLLWGELGRRVTRGREGK
jgi:P-type Ca2+ transporter type 2C